MSYQNKFWNYFSGINHKQRLRGFATIFKQADELRLRGPITIVETGTMREGGDGDGSATQLFDKYCEYAEDGTRAYSFDISQSATDYAISCTKGYIECFCGDSVTLLNKMTFISGVDLLYLDSMDLTHPGRWINGGWKSPQVVKSHTESALHHMMELATVWKCLNRPAVIAIDDVVSMDPSFVSTFGLTPEFVGKDHMVSKFFEQLGIPPIFSEYQRIWKI